MTFRAGVGCTARSSACERRPDHRGSEVVGSQHLENAPVEATGSSLILWHLMLVVFVQRRLGMDAATFGSKRISMEEGKHES